MKKKKKKKKNQTQILKDPLESLSDIGLFLLFEHAISVRRGGGQAPTSRPQIAPDEMKMKSGTPGRNPKDSLA